MRKLFYYSLLLGIIASSACSRQKELNSSDVIEINITEALKNRKDFPLSEIVKDVEILEFESTVDCFMASPRVLNFGKKFILVYDSKAHLFYLFNRQGKFVRKIGEKGKGPGEYYGLQLYGAMDPSEKHIIVANFRSTRVLVYNILGELISEKNLKDHFPSRVIENVRFIDENTIAILPRRPFTPVDNFSSVVLFNLELTKVAQILTRPNDKDLAYSNLTYTSLIGNKEGTFFWETYKDTVYQYQTNGSSIPRYHFNIENNGFTLEYLRDNSYSTSSSTLSFTFVMGVSFLPDYLVAHIADYDMILVFYNLKTGETFSVGRETACDIYESSWKWNFSSMENDIFGIEPAIFASFSPDQNLCAYQYNWDITDTRDLDCIRELEVSRPDIRDQLLEICENPKDNLDLVMIILHLK